jgi:hypothetical protein
MHPGEKEEEVVSSKQPLPALETGPFVLRTLLADVPLSADGDGLDIQITCVEYLGRYVWLGRCRSIAKLLPQTKISTSAHPHPNFFTLYKFHQILKMKLDSHHTS